MAGGGTEVYFDSLTMFVFFLLTGRWLEARMRDRTAGSLEAIMRRLPSSIERQNTDGSFTRVTVRRVQVGDVLRVFPGEAFPADGTLILGDTSANEALLTGESQPVSKPLGAHVIAGSHNLSSNVIMQVVQVGAFTQYAQIVALMERVAVDKLRLALLADRIAKLFLLFVLLAAAGAACGSIAQINGKQAVWQFQVGRLLGYSSLGALAAASVGLLAWLSSQTSILHPLWTFFHVFILSWCLVLGATDICQTANLD